MTRYVVTYQRGDEPPASSVVQTDSTLQAELEFVDNPEKYIPEYAAEDVQVVTVTEIWEDE